MQFEKRRLKYLATINDEALGEDTAPEYELKYIDIGNVDSTGKVSEIADYHFEAAPSRARRIVRNGDVIISTVRTYLEAIAPIENPPENLIVSTGFAVIRPRQDSLSPNYCRYALRERAFINEVVARSTGVSYPAINASDLGDIEIFAPPIEKQETIARFLEGELQSIEALISTKQRLLEFLAEKRRALITHAVTQGLDPNAPMRNSGIPWLGKIPAHWEVKRLRFLAEVRGGLTLGKDYGSRELVEYPYLRVANVQDGFLNLKDLAKVLIPEEDAAGCVLQNGDVLMNEGGDIDKLGRGCVWRDEVEGCLHQNHVFCVRPHAVGPDWLSAWTSTGPAKSYFENNAKRSTNLASISGANIKELPVPLPPTNEQKQILSHIFKNSQALDDLASVTENSLSLLQERRTSLISAVVTGTLGV